VPSNRPIRNRRLSNTLPTLRASSEPAIAF